MVLAELEYPSCPLCGATDRHTVYADMQDYLSGIPGHFAIARCTTCNLSYLCPRPTAARLGDYYPDDYTPFLAAPAVSNARRRLFAMLFTLVVLPYRLRYGHERITLPPFGDRRLLDVGCGAGAYLQDMQRLGWDVHGSDLSPTAVREAASRVGSSHVHLGTLAAVDSSVTCFDLITMNHILEHVPDPVETLQEAARRLAPHGKVKIIVPDVSGWEARLFGRYWVGLDVPRHLINFSRSTLEDALSRSSLCVDSWRPVAMPYTVYASFNLVTKILWHSPWPIFGQVLGRVLFYLFVLSYPLGNRGAIEVVARRSR